MTSGLFRSLAKVSVDLSNDDEFGSSVERIEFFIAHFDVAAILEFPMMVVPSKTVSVVSTACARHIERWTRSRSQNCGRVGGGGADFLSLRYEVRRFETFQWNQMEVPLGILRAVAAQRIPVSSVLVDDGSSAGADDVDAETAERWGF